MSPFIAIPLAFLLLAINAFFVGAEFSLISSRKDRLEALVAHGKSAAKRVEYASEHLSMMLAGAQFGITLASLLLGKVGEPAIAHLIEVPAHALGLPANLLHPVSFAISLAIVTYLHILLGEMVPKNIALAGPESVAMLLVPAHIVFVKATRPFIVVMNEFARLTLRLFGIEQKDELDSTVDQRQLATMIAESRSEGLLDAEEHARLDKALGTTGRKVTEVLIPLDEVQTLDFGRQGPLLTELEQKVRETGFSRFPVTGIGGGYLGYIHIKDILDRVVHNTDQGSIPRSEIRPLISLDADLPIDVALRTMRRKSAHMAQIRRRGNLIGVVALEDLIEEYVGTVNDWTHH